jgi:hypothetical protein
MTTDHKRRKAEKRRERLRKQKGLKSLRLVKQVALTTDEIGRNEAIERYPEQATALTSYPEEAKFLLLNRRPSSFELGYLMKLAEQQSIFFRHFDPNKDGSVLLEATPVTKD